MPEARARLILETLVSTVFVADVVRCADMTIVSMGDTAKAFIASWASEKCRHALASQESARH